MTTQTQCNELIAEMLAKIAEQKSIKATGKDCSKFILTGFTIEQLNQVSYFLRSYKD